MSSLPPDAAAFARSFDVLETGILPALTDRKRKADSAIPLS